MLCRRSSGKGRVLQRTGKAEVFAMAADNVLLRSRDVSPDVSRTVMSPPDLPKDKFYVVTGTPRDRESGARGGVTLSCTGL